MKQYAQFILVVLLTILTLTPAAANDVFNRPVVSAAEMDALQQRLNDISGWNVQKGTYRQLKTVPKINRTFESSGEFLFSGDKGIIWDVEDPFPSRTILKEQSMIQVAADGGRSELDAAANAVFTEFSSAILAVFSGDYYALSTHFSLYFTQTGGKGILGMIPSDPLVATVVESLVLEIGTGLETLTMKESGGGSVEYRFDITERRDELTDDETTIFDG